MSRALNFLSRDVVVSNVKARIQDSANHDAKVIFLDADGCAHSGSCSTLDTTRHLAQPHHTDTLSCCHSITCISTTFAHPNLSRIVLISSPLLLQQSISWTPLQASSCSTPPSRTHPLHPLHPMSCDPPSSIRRHEHTRKDQKDLATIPVVERRAAVLVLLGAPRASQMGIDGHPRGLVKWAEVGYTHHVEDGSRVSLGHPCAHAYAMSMPRGILTNPLDQPARAQAASEITPGRQGDSTHEQGSGY